MIENIVHVGIDVDDVRWHGSALDKRTGKCWSFTVVRTLKGLVGQLEKVCEYFGGVQWKLCYEASYVGFSLQRDLRLRQGRSPRLPGFSDGSMARIRCARS